MTDQSQLLDIDQIAAWVMISKRSMQRYIPRMPPPVRRGVRGRRALWAWQEVRPWLVETFGLPKLPERLPEADATDDEAE